jgi:Domain of unknown function (DUF4157)
MRGWRSRSGRSGRVGHDNVPHDARLSDAHDRASAKPAAQQETSQQAFGNQAAQALYNSGALRAKLELGGIDSPEERQANAVADRVMRAPEEPCCSGCATGGNCEEPVVQRAADSSQVAQQPLSLESERQLQALTTGGEALPPQEREFFEQRLGDDLGDVRIHRDSMAQEAAQTIHARAFTVGSHIGFGAGHWSPQTSSGRHLIAHELAHVRQSGRADSGGSADAGSVRRQPASPVPEPEPPFRPAPGLLGKETGRTTTDQSRRIEVTIRRTDRCGPQDVDLIFDPDSDCSIETGRDVEFVPSPVAASRLSSADFETLAQRFLDQANTYLDGWFAIRISGGPGCTAPCQDRQMPIHVRINRSKGGQKIVLSGGSAREDTGSFHPSTGDWTLRHEASHIALGTADEYEESGVPCREGENVEERDWSLMAKPNLWGRRSLLHPRHFSHIVTWFEREFPGCRIELIPLRDPRPLDFDIQLSMGAVGMGAGRGLAVDAGFRFGFPLDHLRNWAFSVGPHAHLLTTTADGESRDAYLLGLRFGLERRFTPSAGGPFLGGFGELGYGTFNLNDLRSDSLTHTSESGAYGLVGLRAGYAFQHGLLPPAVSIDAALGTPIGGPGIIGEPGQPLPQTRVGWWQLGLTATWRF